MISTWDILSGDVKPAGRVLIYDESGDNPAMQAAELAAEAGAEVDVMTPDRSIAPEVMGMNLAPYLRNLQRHNVRLSVAERLLGVARDGNQLCATIGTDYSGYTREERYDQVVVNYGIRPLDDLYFALRDGASNRGELDHDSFIGGKPQRLRTNPDGRYQLFRIGDAVSSRNTHAAIYDALRLCHAM